VIHGGFWHMRVLGSGSGGSGPGGGDPGGGDPGAGDPPPWDPALLGPADATSNWITPVGGSSYLSDTMFEPGTETWVESYGFADAFFGGFYLPGGIVMSRGRAIYKANIGSPDAVVPDDFVPIDMLLEFPSGRPSDGIHIRLTKSGGAEYILNISTNTWIASGEDYFTDPWGTTIDGPSNCFVFELSGSFIELLNHGSWSAEFWLIND
jgi:hypothetical protein